MPSSAPRLRGTLEIEGVLGTFLGDTRIRLLEAIDRHGSISQAAKAVPLSYKAAWDAVDAMNNLAEEPLVVRSAGGKQGGGTRLTAHGRSMIALYRALEAEYQSALERLTANLNQHQHGDFQAFRQLLQRFAVKSSARNQFAGRIVGLTPGEVDYEVRIALDGENTLVAVITGESAENMGLCLELEVSALVKSSSVLLFNDPTLKTSARNQFWGEVARIHEGPVNAEVTLALSGGRTVCAVVTRDSLDTLGLAVGRPAGAAFKASSVILCRQ
jgi:molybdate transport system regulatory protein